MSKPLAFTSLLLVSTALVAPISAWAQTSLDAAASIATQPQTTERASPDEGADVSLPGGSDQEIVVTGKFIPNAIRATPEVVSVLSTADIARTGEGDIAGALGRVTGLSVVGNGYVYVRGLGDRYSLALLNGSPLPSPEPLKRVVPLDLFPTNVIASSLVQKSYSVNFPGEFGGGVINLTTKAVPKESFVAFGGGVGFDSETTNRLGYTYYGSRTDWTGYDNGTRNTPPALQDFFNSGARIGDGTVDTQAIGSQIVTARNSLVQRNRHLPPNFSASITGGTAWDIGSDARLGLIATAGYSNKLKTRDTIQQTPSTADLSQKELDFERVITDDRVVVNGLLGLGLEFGENKIRWTNFYVRDTLKQTRLGLGSEATTGFTRMNQDTAWYERQLIDTQLVGEFKFGDLHLDLRGGYANSQREAPFELSFGYVRSNRDTDPFGQLFVNRLNNGQNGSASVAFSDLNEDLWSGGADLSYRLVPAVTLSAGYAYSDTSRTSSRREFQFIAPSDFPVAVGLFRPDYLLQPSVIKAFKISMVETTESDPAFAAGLTTHAGYGQLEAELATGLNVSAGVRYETAKQTVSPIQLFTTPSSSLASTNLNNDYWLPAATVTWEFAPDMQIRMSASKTIARPQFRELIFQQYFDPETNRQYRGNPLLTDSRLTNAEGRFEWYFAKDQRITVAAFYKKIDKPIEAFTGFSDNQPQTSYANAPRANLYGAEFEVQKYFDLSGLGDSGFWAPRRFVFVANYTYTQSKLQVGANDMVAVFGTAVQPALNFFRDGSPLTGQADHVGNLQLGIEDQDHLSQQTFLFTYSSSRVTSRGPVGLPDLVEKPGLQIDFVARQGFTAWGKEVELKFEARNLTGRRYEESQTLGSNTIYYNLYNVGRTVALSASLKF